jgi:hypothetical protein
MNRNCPHKGMLRSSLACRVGWLGLIAMLGFGLLCPQSFGQGRGQTRTRQKEQKPPVELAQKTDLPKIMTVTGEGGRVGDVRRQFQKVAMPASLSQQVKNSVIKSAGGKETQPHDSFTLTPAKPYQTQGALAFEEIAYLDPAQNELTIENQDSFWDGRRSNKAVFVFINTTAGKKYLIDLSVTGDKFLVATLPGNAKETFSGTNHILIVFEARSSQLEINLTGTGGNGQYVWWFHSCEVTPLN